MDLKVALRGLIFSTLACQHEGQGPASGCNPFLTAFSLCLALPVVTGIFGLRKRPNVGSKIGDEHLVVGLANDQMLVTYL